MQTLNLLSLWGGGGVGKRERESTESLTYKTPILTQQ